eukprot:TRINITY_DN3519_c0_g1_i7.p1 TRINITY_DN3519_c0_g1~~TRINITY_DN3519_c0_g1_i7.p1  ORF type:complete len:190 (+),score=66.05 TRINITY_DN3519_c0_g1_i7:80-649(+)
MCIRDRYRSFFKEIIKADPYFGGLLSKIQEAYENRIAELKHSSAKQLGLSQDKRWSQLLEEERKKRKEAESKRVSAMQQLKRCKQHIAELKETVRTLKLSTALNEPPALNSEPIVTTEVISKEENIRKKPLVPRIDLRKVKEQESKEEVEALDYHDEFMEMEDLFSQPMYSALIPVSYTHLTLPTICSV